MPVSAAVYAAANHAVVGSVAPAGPYDAIQPSGSCWQIRSPALAGSAPANTEVWPANDRS